jgi:hypothetical protein
MKKTKSHTATIFIAGSIQDIEKACRKYCLVGMCVTVTPTNFIFTGGSESGAAIGIINYARFPRALKETESHALKLAKILLLECCQRSCSVVTDLNSYYISNEQIEVKR